MSDSLQNSEGASQVSGAPSVYTPTITVVVCARNAAKHLRRTLPAVLALDYPKDKLQVLLVDNGSSDDTGAIGKKYGARVVRHPTPGVAAARDVGWRACNTELVAYLDSDCVPPVDWLKRAVLPFAEDERCAAVGARLVTASIRTLAEEHIDKRKILHTDSLWTRNDLQFPFLVTACIVLRRSALEAINGFDRSFGRAAGEDADLCIRLNNADYTMTYLRDIVVRHHHRSTIWGMLRQAHWYGIGQANLFARWHEQLGWSLYVDRTPYDDFLGNLWRAPFAPLTRIGKGKYHRYAPLLSALEVGAFLLGKYRGAIKNRVVFL